MGDFFLIKGGDKYPEKQNTSEETPNSAMSSQDCW